MDIPDAKARMVGRVRHQGACKIGDSDQPRIATNVRVLKRLSIRFSVATNGALTGNGANPILAIILALVDLRKCKSAQAAVQLINANRAEAMTRAWHSFDFKLPVTGEFSLTELAPPARQKYLLDTKLSILVFEGSHSRT